MYHHHYGLCARRAMALILLFVLVSQRPYSPSGQLATVGPVSIGTPQRFGMQLKFR